MLDYRDRISLNKINLVVIHSRSQRDHKDQIQSGHRHGKHQKEGIFQAVFRWYSGAWLLLRRTASKNPKRVN